MRTSKTHIADNGGRELRELFRGRQRVQGGTASVSEVRGEGNTRLLRSLGVENLNVVSTQRQRREDGSGRHGMNRMDDERRVG